MARQTASKEAVERLLQAWRGEVQARETYNVLAARMGDSRRAEIIRAIADAEASHRERIEKRLRELGQPVPDPSSVKLSALQRLQARLQEIAQEYSNALRASGRDPVAPPPFGGLALVPASLFA